MVSTSLDIILYATLENFVSNKERKDFLLPITSFCIIVTLSIKDHSEGKKFDFNFHNYDMYMQLQFKRYLSNVESDSAM
ncbi:34721_t:CDS:2 [Gigaspora margarita]|uniref:34721_t:CDS:1 n=1 Tax=Gigaspora margarita TaxID=4874 RepID=A0ABN7V5X1_GIGMA|nr:34721_t:CDS:2 [Gigaspora margarita]